VNPGGVSALERAGATVITVEGNGITPALRHLAGLGIHSLVIEGGAAIHAAAWDEGVVDYVQLYVAPQALGAAGVPLLDGRSFSPASLVDGSIDQLGPDVLIEGYVHRPH
jgi:diaminohydroxyphosphoribosylaminopyrimidine deaminase/5-amino-6-(5-phosphoribosylamino)uracil reductase